MTLCELELIGLFFQLAECIQEQNSGITWNENGALRIPYEQMKQILKPTVDTVVGKIESALKEYDYDNLVLTGGCAKCTYLNETISAQFPGLKIILPKVKCPAYLH